VIGEPKLPSSPGNVVAAKVRALQAGTRRLPAKLICKAAEVELTAHEGRAGAVADRAFDTNGAVLKKFIRKNRDADFTLRMRASGGVADQIRQALGAEDFYRRTTAGEQLDLREFPMDVGGRESIFLANGDVSVWRGVTVRWPRDPAGKATLRGALVILTTPVSAGNTRPLF